MRQPLTQLLLTPCMLAGDAAGAGPAVYDAVSAAITTGIGQHLPGASHEGAGAGGPAWRPRGVLVSHLQEHRSAVTCLAASANGALLLSGSEDETVKVSAAAACLRPRLHACRHGPRACAL